MNILNVTTAAFFFLAAGIFTSVTILSAYQILFAIPLIYCTYLAIKNNQWNLPKSAWFLLAFTVIALISLIINIELIPKPSKNFGRLKYFIFGIGGIYVLQFWLKNTTLKIKKFLTNTFFLTIVLACLAAIYSALTKNDDQRARAFTDTMRYGYGTAMVLASLLPALLNQDKIKSWFNWKFALITFIFGFIGMYLTYTRGALLAFLCALPFAIYFFNKKIGLILGTASTLIVLTLGGFYFFGTQKYESRFLLNKSNSSDVMRRSQWKAAIIAIQERPVLGWGPSNFHSQLARIKNQYDLDAKDYDDAHAHNLFLEIGAGTGLVGLALFLGWLVCWAWECFKTGGLVRALVVPFGVAFVVGSQFEVTFDANNVSMIFFLYSLSSTWSTDVKQS